MAQETLYHDLVVVQQVPLEQIHETVATNPEVQTSILELLAFIAPLPLRDQIYMLTNTLTVSGYSQREIADALGVKYQAYRNRLLEIRKDFVYDNRHRF